MTLKDYIGKEQLTAEEEKLLIDKLSDLSETDRQGQPVCAETSGKGYAQSGTAADDETGKVSGVLQHIPQGQRARIGKAYAPGCIEALP